MLVGAVGPAAATPVSLVGGSTPSSCIDSAPVSLVAGVVVVVPVPVTLPVGGSPVEGSSTSSVGCSPSSCGTASCSCCSENGVNGKVGGGGGGLSSCEEVGC